MPARPLSAFICAITPFDENDKIDEEAIRVLFGRFAGTGVGAFVGTASPGEGQALSRLSPNDLFGEAMLVASRPGAARGVPGPLPDCPASPRSNAGRGW